MSSIKMAIYTYKLLLVTYLIWFHGDDGTECKDKWMDILHVQVISGYSVRY